MYTNQASSSVAHPCMNKKECPKASGERTERRKTTSHSPRAPTCKAGGQKRRENKKTDHYRLGGKTREVTQSVVRSLRPSGLLLMLVGRGRSRRLRLGGLLVGPRRWNFSGKEEKKRNSADDHLACRRLIPTTKRAAFWAPKAMGKSSE